jgi:hypothetical protein
LWLFVTPALVFVGVGLVQLWPKGIVEVFLGAQPSLQAGCRASIAALSNLFLKYPHSSEYNTRWQVDTKRFQMQYSSREQAIFYGEVGSDNSVSGEINWYHVEKEYIHKIAQKNGTLEDLRAYGSGHSTIAGAD